MPKWHFLEHKSSRKVDDWFWVHTRPSNEFKVKRGSRLGILDGNNEFILKKTRRRIWSIFLRIYLSTNDISRLTLLKKITLEFEIKCLVPLLILKSVYVKNDKEDPSLFIMSACKIQSKFQNMYLFLIGRHLNLIDF